MINNPLMDEQLVAIRRMPRRGSKGLGGDLVRRQPPRIAPLFLAWEGTPGPSTTKVTTSQMASFVGLPHALTIIDVHAKRHRLRIASRPRRRATVRRDKP